MEKIKILVAMPDNYIRSNIFTDDAKNQLNLMGKVIWPKQKSDLSKKDLIKMICNCEVCISGWGSPSIDKEVLKYDNKLNFIGHAAGSVHRVICPEVFNRGITVVTANEVLAGGLAEYNLFVMMLALKKFFYHSKRLKENGIWPSPEEKMKQCRTMEARTVGIIGFGAVAKKLVDFLKMFGVKILVCSNHLAPEEAEEYGCLKVSLDELLVESEVIHLLKSLTKNTFHFLNREHLSLIKDGAVLINSSRGAIINERALVEELSTGRFFAVLDVYEIEPLPTGSPLRSLDNVLLTPHIGSFGVEEKLGRLVVNELHRFLKGQPLLHKVTVSQWKRMTH